MDDQPLDRLARALADRTSRRGVLGLLGAVTSLSTGEGLARSARQHRRDIGAEACRTLTQSCTKKRPGIGRWRKCCSGLVCRNKACRIKECSSVLGCGEGQGCCDGTCIDVQRDPKNCGQCGKQCGGAPCLGGQCLSACVEGLTSCNGACVDLLRDPAHCGACGITCDDGLTCQDGQCTCRQRLEPCEASAQCCQNARRAPLAHPDLFSGVVTCSDRSGELIPGIVACDDPPEGDSCCVGTGAICRTDCDCCGQLRCLEDAGCGVCMEAGLPCPSVCPLNGPCDFCCTNECVAGYCRRRNSNPNCQPYGQPCHTDFSICCNDVPCSGGLCRFN